MMTEKLNLGRLNIVGQEPTRRALVQRESTIDPSLRVVQIHRPKYMKVNLHIQRYHFQECYGLISVK